MMEGDGGGLDSEPMLCLVIGGQNNCSKERQALSELSIMTDYIHTYVKTCNTKQWNYSME